ncbi:MAG: sigma-70 family RNA polymerase sigma factor [Deltaproteobacteria bacterium]|nr:sigma-70 family RNA polymerase sigma factor [Deltaproteobacteria bacterium]
MMDDLFLVEQVKQGNKNAYRFLILRYQRPLFKFLSGFGFPPQNIEDLAQEAFLKCYHSIASFDSNKGSFSSWLFIIAKHLALNEVKRKYRTNEQPMERLEQVVAVSEAVSLGDQISKKEKVQRLREAIAVLPLVFQNAIHLCCIDELELEDAAAIENVAIGTMKSRIFRGKNLLRKKLITEGVI